MKKKLLLRLMMGVCILACYGCNPKKESSAGQDIKEFAELDTEMEVKELKDLKYDKCDVITVSVYEIAKDTSYGAFGRIIIKNNGKKTISDYYVEINVLDGKGKKIGVAGATSDYALEPGKEVVAEAFFNDESVEASTIKDISLKEYSYNEDLNYYTLEVADKKVSGYSSNEFKGNVDYNKANILDIKTEKCDCKCEDDAYYYHTIVHNKSNLEIKTLSIDSALLDKNGRMLDEGIADTDDDIASDKKITLQGSGTEEKFAKDIVSSELYRYSYELKEKDDKGFNYYIINLQNKTAEGMYQEPVKESDEE